MFGLGRQTSSSSSLSFGQSGSSSTSFSEGLSQSTTGSQSTQSIAFEDLFRSLFTGASGAAAKVAEAAPILQGEAAQLFSGGAQFLDTLRGGADTAYTDARLAGPDAAAEAQIAALGENLGGFFNEQLLPAITGRGVASGTFGGSREGVAQSLAVKQVAGQFSQGTAQILAQSQAQRDALAGVAGGQRIQAATAGLSALPSMLGLAEAGSNAALSPFLALSQILGGPTVLTQAESAGQSSSSDIARAISEAFSLDYSTSTSKSKGTSLSFGGFGGGRS